MIPRNEFGEKTKNELSLSSQLHLPTKYFRSIIKFSITVRNADPCDGNKYFSIIELRLEKHPDKTFIRRIEKGVDFLGYHFSPEGLSVAEKTIEKFLARAVRLYEQEQGESFGSPPTRIVRTAVGEVDKRNRV